MTRCPGLFIKRMMDIGGALALLAVFGTPMLVLALLVRFKLGSPIIFRSPRIGQHAKTIYVYKFRSMLDLRDEQGKLLPDEQRLTRFCKILRSTSLDELPQIINILKGEMSFIGPRPILTDFYPYLNDKELKRLEMLPGITGLAQVNGRNSLEWDKRLEMDVWYVENWSLWLDIKVALKTLPVWLGGQGINTPGFATFQRLDDCRAPARPALDQHSEPVAHKTANV